MNFLRLVALMIVIAALSFCSGGPKEPDKAVVASTASARLQAIPYATPEKYHNVIDMKKWRNPYLVILPEGVGLLDPANNEQHLLKIDEMLDALAALPPSAWPYGRIVVVTESPLTSTEEQRVAIRRNKGIVAATLEDAHVLINWVPSA
jgi:hypothetical protein